MDRIEFRYLTSPVLVGALLAKHDFSLRDVNIERIKLETACPHADVFVVG